MVFMEVERAKLVLDKKGMKKLSVGHEHNFEDKKRQKNG
jgi:hypothetical protein